jgi:hypothetical protein
MNECRRFTISWFKFEFTVFFSHILARGNAITDAHSQFAFLNDSGILLRYGTRERAWLLGAVIRTWYCHCTSTRKYSSREPAPQYVSQWPNGLVLYREGHILVLLKRELNIPLSYRVSIYISIFHVHSFHHPSPAADKYPSTINPSINSSVRF